MMEGFATLLILAAAVSGQAAPTRMAPPAMQTIAPPLARSTDELLFGDVWKRPGLSRRDRSLVTVSALINSGKAAQLTSHLNIALDNGLTADQLSAVITNAAFYSGWPNAVSAIGVAKEVFAKRGVRVTGREDGPLPPDAATSDASRQTLLARYGSVIDALWARTDLSQRDRALATFAALVANGDASRLSLPLTRGRAAGLTRAELEEAVLHLSFYAGRPKAEAAEPFVEAAFRDGQAMASSAGMTVARKGSGDQASPQQNFTGAVRTSTPFRGTGNSRIGGATVTFAPGARTIWHTHPLGQTLAVTEGCGLTQVAGGPVQRICAGDVVTVEPGAKHWHGATQTQAMTHVAIGEALNGKSVDWLEPVSDAQYAAGASVR